MRGSLGQRTANRPALPGPEPAARCDRRPYELWQRLDLSGVESPAVKMILEQAALALEAGDRRQARALALLAFDVARRVWDTGGEAAALVILGLAAGQMRHIETAQRIYRRENDPAARYNEALCGYVLALRARTRQETLELLQEAAGILGQKSNWVYYRDGTCARANGRRVEALAGAVRRAMGQVVPVVYVVGAVG